MNELKKLQDKIQFLEDSIDQAVKYIKEQDENNKCPDSNILLEILIKEEK